MAANDDFGSYDSETTVRDNKQSNEYKADETVRGHKCELAGWKTVRLLGKGSYGSVYEICKEYGVGGESHSAMKVITIPKNRDEYKNMLDDGYDEKGITAIFRSQVEDITEEFRTMEKLKGNTNIVSCEDLQIIEHEDGRGWDILIRMELLTPLKEYCRANGGMNEQQVKKLGVDLCRALEVCRAENIIHRDIKPENIFVNKHGDFKLGDFGIARTFDAGLDASAPATRAGTYPFMAPEVYKGKKYNGSVDIYSLGMVLYWALNRQRGPFLPLPPTAPPKAAVEDALKRRMGGEMLPPPADGGGELAAAVLKACAYSPAARYSTPQEMSNALAAGKGKSPLKIIAICACAAVALAGVLIFLLVRGTGDTRPQPVPVLAPTVAPTPVPTFPPTPVPTVEPELGAGVFTGNLANCTMLSFTAASASSESGAYDGSTYYYPVYACDGNITTSWQEGATGYGEGEYLRFDYGKTENVDVLTFVLGSHTMEGYYEENGKPRRVRFDFSDGSSFSYEFPSVSERYTIVLNRTVKTEWIMLTIESVYTGTKFQDTAIAEVASYSLNGERSDSAPSAADLEGCDDRLVYPQTDSYLSGYEYKLTASTGGRGVYLRTTPTNSTDHVCVVPDDTTVIVIARENGYSLSIVSDGVAGWIKSSLLK